MSEETLYDVAIVGYGPVGAVLAALLGQAGISVYVCDQLNDVYEIPRAIALDHEILRVFQQIGIVDAVLPYVEPFTPSEFYGVDGQLIRRLTMIEAPYPLGYTPSVVFTQPPVERILRTRVAALSNVTVDLSTELLEFSQTGAQVTLKVRRATDAGAFHHTVNAKWMIGCDGGGSRVRSALNIALEDLDFDEPWLVVDALVNAEGLKKLPRTSVQYCEPERPCTFVIGPNNHRRWEISLKPGEDPVKAASAEGTWALLRRWIAPGDGDLWRQSSYRFHALVAERWRDGRIFLAGDAAHMQPPFLGQGMCQGIRDAANLAWKLERVVRGQVPAEQTDTLLDSYPLERKAHVSELIQRLKKIGEVICERDVNKARERDANMLAACGGVVKDTPRQDILPSLQNGIVSARGVTGRGTLFPQVVQEGKRMDDAIGYGWRLLHDGTLSTPTQSGLRCINVTQAFATGNVAQTWLDKHGVHAALVRPDHYVYGTAASGAQLMELLDEALGSIN